MSARGQIMLATSSAGNRNMDTDFTAATSTNMGDTCCGVGRI